MIVIPKGTKDVLPKDSYKWHYIENKVRELTESFGFSEIRTPTFEYTELFLRGVGDTTDIVNKEMYTFIDKGGRSITLKPEGTAGVARSFIENGLSNNPMPLKMYYITPVFRYEKPQSGRLREHHQFGIELYGSYDAKADVEVISLAKTLLNNLGITQLELNINNIGCPKCRQEYSKALKNYYEKYKDLLCETCLERLEKNPLRLLDCKVPQCHELAANAPIVLDYLCDECKENHEKTKKYLDILGIDYKINPQIVRGLDYYTGTVFEYVSTAIGSQGTVCGGGRYNNLVTDIGGKPMPAVGFGMGLERLMMVMDAAGLKYGNYEKCKVYIAALGSQAEEIAYKLTYDLRKNGVYAETDLMGKSLKAQMKYADKIGAEYVAIIGDNEVEAKAFTLKNMYTKSEEQIAFDDLMQIFSGNM